MLLGGLYAFILKIIERGTDDFSESASCKSCGIVFGNTTGITVGGREGGDMTFDEWWRCVLLWEEQLEPVEHL